MRVYTESHYTKKNSPSICTSLSALFRPCLSWHEGLQSSVGVEKNDACPRVSFSLRRFYFWCAMVQRYRAEVGVQLQCEGFLKLSCCGKQIPGS